MTLAALDLSPVYSGPARHEILQMSLQALERLSHRGGVDADGASGDGAGLLTSLPMEFFRARAAEEQINLGELFGVGMLFVPAARAFRCSRGDGRRHRPRQAAPRWLAPRSGELQLPWASARLKPCRKSGSFSSSRFPPRTTRPTPPKNLSAALRFFASARKPCCPSAAISARCRRAPSFTRACSPRGSFLVSSKISAQSRICR